MDGRLFGIFTTKKIMRSKIDGYKDIHTWSETNNYKIDIRCYTYFVCVFKESKFFQIYSVYIENESLTETKKKPSYPCLIPGIYVIVIYGYANVHR